MVTAVLKFIMGRWEIRIKNSNTFFNRKMSRMLLNIGILFVKKFVYL
ncbi:hypothetical protein MIDIC_170029 [Alphaproteobacteria bacterium]